MRRPVRIANFSGVVGDRFSAFFLRQLRPQLGVLAAQDAKAVSGSWPSSPYGLGSMLGEVAFARVGDKGANASLGVWARSRAAYEWLTAYLTAAELARLPADTSIGK